MGVFDVLLALARPELPAPGEQVHPVDQGAVFLVEVGAPETEQFLRLVDEDLPVQRTQELRRAQVEDQKPLGAHEQMQPPEDLRQEPGLKIVERVERAERRVHGAVEVERLGALAQKERRRRALDGLALRLHEHVHRPVAADHLIAARGQKPGQRPGAAAQIEQQAEFPAVRAKQRLVKIGKGSVGHVARQPVVPAGERGVAAHFSRSFMRSNTTEYPPRPYCRERLTRLIVALEAPVSARMSL